MSDGAGSRASVVVVGGGLAGLAAAVACADAGAEVTLLESRTRLGGATASFTRDGMTIDTGQHVFLRCCTAYRSFLDRIGATGWTELQPRMDIPVLAPGHRPARLRRSNLPPPLHLASAMAGYPFLSPMDKVRAARASLAIRRVDPRDPAADAVTFGSWLRRHGQSPASVRYLWDLFGLPTLNLPADQASLALAAKVFRTGLLESKDAADVGVPTVPLSELHAVPAARALASAGATVRTSVRVRGVSAGPGGLLTAATDDGALDADAVIVTVPHDRVGELLPRDAALGVDRFASLGVSPIVNVHVVYDRAVTGLRFAAAADSPVQWLFDRTSAGGLDRGQYLALSLSGAQGIVDRPVEWFRATFVPALAALLPRARQATVERFLVTRERSATFAQVPGTAALRPGPATRVPGLYLAGAWTDTGWPATMEGAVRSGRAAAEGAMAFLGRRPGRSEPMEVVA